MYLNYRLSGVSLPQPVNHLLFDMIIKSVCFKNTLGGRMESLLSLLLHEMKSRPDTETVKALMKKLIGVSINAVSVSVFGVVSQFLSIPFVLF